MNRNAVEAGAVLRGDERDAETRVAPNLLSKVANPSALGDQGPGSVSSVRKSGSALAEPASAVKTRIIMTEYTIERNAKVCRVVLGGDLTASVVPELRTGLKTELERGAEEVTFDLEKTAMLDSSGIGLLVATHNSLTTRQGTLRVVSVSGEILRLLQSMRLVNRLNVTGRATS